MYKRLQLAYGFLLVLVFSFNAFAQTSDDFPDLIEKTKPSVVSVIAFDNAGKRLMRGTGFFVATDRVITNHHVIKGAFRTEIQTSEKRTYSVIKIDAAYESADLALLQIEQPIPGIRPLAISTVAPRVGERILVLGNPLGLAGSVSDGIVSAFRVLPKIGKLIQITAPISQGSSGSPVVNMNGAVIGVATLNLEGGQNLNFAVSSEKIKEIWSKLLFVNDSQSSGRTKPSGRWRSLISEDITYDTETIIRKLGTVLVWIQYKEADGSYEKVLTDIDCNSSQIRSVRSLVYDKNGNLTRQNERLSNWKGLVPDSSGEGMYKIFCKDQPDSQSIQDWYRRNDLIDKAGNLIDLKNYEDAIIAFSQIIQEFPESAAYGFSRIGVAKQEQGKLREARNSLIEAIKLEPSDYYYQLLGGIYEKEKNIPAAIVSYWKSLRLAKKHYSARWVLKEIYVKTNNFKGLTSLYKFLIEQGQLDYYDALGDVYEKQGLKTLAQSTRIRGVNDLEKKIKLDKAEEHYYVSLAALYKSLNNQKKFELTLISGFEKFPANFSLSSLLAKNYNDSKRWVKAVEVVKIALPLMEYGFYKKSLLQMLRASYQALNQTADVKQVETILSELK